MLARPVLLLQADFRPSAGQGFPPPDVTGTNPVWSPAFTALSLAISGAFVRSVADAVYFSCR